jgi:DNA-binding MarR family transcriptional regulator
MLENYNKAFESRIRLGVMSVLMVNESADFSTLKSLLEVTDGNLASHLKALEENEYVEVSKQFIGRKPNTTYKVTPLGRKAFEEHLKALESLLKK